MAAVKIPDMPQVTKPAADMLIPAVQPTGSPLNVAIGKPGLLWLLSRTDGIDVAAGINYAVQDADLAKTIALLGAGSTITLDGTARGSGFWIQVWNLTGSDWTVPTINGAVRHYGSNDGVHSKVKAGARAVLGLITANSTLYCMIDGETA